MKTPFILMERSAMGDQQRYAILTNELIRRLSTIDTEYVTAGEVMEVIEVFICEMKSSGYSREQTRETVVAGVKGWKRKAKNILLCCSKSTNDACKHLISPGSRLVVCVKP